MDREELLEALKNQDWESVVRGGVVLYAQEHCNSLGETARDVSNAALFILENPTFSEVAPQIVRIAESQLKNAGGQ